MPGDSSAARDWPSDNAGDPHHLRISSAGASSLSRSSENGLRGVQEGRARGAVSGHIRPHYETTAPHVRLIGLRRTARRQVNTVGSRLRESIAKT